MLLRCTSCKRDVGTNAEGRLPPWCPSCGGNLKPVEAAKPAVATATAVIAAPGSAGAYHGAANGAAHANGPTIGAHNAAALADTAATLTRPREESHPTINLDALGEPGAIYRGSGWRQLLCWLVALVCLRLARCIGYAVLPP